MIRIVRKEDTVGLRAWAVRAGAILAALAASVLLVLLMGYDPIRTFGAMLQGAFGTEYGRINTIIMAVALAMTALAVSVAFSMKFWNIGAEGQILMGAFAATAAARVLPEGTPPVLLVLACLLAGLAGGAAWALVPGLFRIYLGTNETLFTLMMNYIAIKFVVLLRCLAWKDPAANGFPVIAEIPAGAFLPPVLGVHAGWILAVLLAVATYYFLRSTKLGYEIRVVGESERTARYAGMDVRRVVVTGVLVSGAMAGLTGAVKLMGVAHTLSETVAGGDGFTAIIIAWLANLSAPGIVVASVLFAALKQGTLAMEIVGSPPSLSDVIKGLILMAALSTEFFLRYRIAVERRDARATAVHPPAGPGQAEGGPSAEAGAPAEEGG